MLQPWKVIVIHTDEIIFHIATVLQIIQAFWSSLGKNFK
jgi:hypothetical protein